MTAAVIIEDVEVARPPSPRWLVALRGVFWLVVAIAVLSFTPTSAWVIGTVMAAVVIVGAIDELLNSVTSDSWRWLHGVVGGVFLVVGILALIEPFQTFGVLALFIGWYLLVKGFFDIFLAVAGGPLWGLVLTIGIAQVLLGIWALGYPGRSAWLLVLWVGTGALLRGVGDLVRAFSHREVV